MKAVIFDAVGQPLRLDTRPDPTPARDEVVLRVAGCGICGSDLHITEDPAPFGDAVAVVPMRGCGSCDRCLAGDPARCPQMALIGGGYAEYVTVAARQCRVMQGYLLSRPLPAERVTELLRAQASDGTAAAG
jgi:(R,R)-butanediol dehydrogenase/meso-butanediol dehydrogenase/diacetyl reductase